MVSDSYPGVWQHCSLRVAAVLLQVFHEVLGESRDLLVDLLEAIGTAIVRILHHLTAADALVQFSTLTEIAKQAHLSNLRLSPVCTDRSIYVRPRTLRARLGVGLPLQRRNDRVSHILQVAEIGFIHSEQVVEGEEVFPCHFASSVVIASDFVAPEGGHGAGVGRFEAVVGGCASGVDLTDGGVGSGEVAEHSFGHRGTT
jgi:hypothetical protein